MMGAKVSEEWDHGAWMLSQGTAEWRIDHFAATMPPRLRHRLATVPTRLRQRSTTLSTTWRHFRERLRVRLAGGATNSSSGMKLGMFSETQTSDSSKSIKSSADGVDALTGRPRSLVGFG